VSENKPVGSSSGGDLLINDDVVTSPTTNGQAGGQTNDDLLAEIFGGSSSTSAAPDASGSTSPAAPKSQKSTIDDILGLFGNTSAPATTSSPSPAPSGGSGLDILAGLSSTSPPPAQPASNPMSTFSLPQSQSPAPAQPAPSRLQSYTAYEKNDLKITLTPQTSAAKPGVVMILARFQVSGSAPVTGIVFQAAVPKTQQLQMLPMSNPNVNPGSTETQQMRVIAPVGVSFFHSLVYCNYANRHFLERCAFASTDIVHYKRSGRSRPGRFLRIPS